jgi:hypothetical protein
MPPDRAASQLVLERIPYIFQNSWPNFRTWRADLASRLDVDPCDIYIAGSAASGVSLSPYKNFRAFNATSDIDVAVVSPFHFDQAWRILRTARRTFLDESQWQAVQSHRTNYIYWGCVATDRVLPLMPFAREWQIGLAHIEGLAPVNGRSMTVRLYRDNRSLRDYTQHTISILRQKVLADDV